MRKNCAEENPLLPLFAEAEISFLANFVRGSALAFYSQLNWKSHLEMTQNWKRLQSEQIFPLKYVDEVTYKFKNIK